MENDGERWLASWAEVTEYLASRHHLGLVRGRSLGLVLDGGERVGVSACGPDRLEIVAPVCGAFLLAPERVLKRSRALPLGALVLDNHRYLVRHVVVLGLRAESLEQLLDEIARTAASLRPPSPRPELVFEVFANFAA